MLRTIPTIERDPSLFPSARTRLPPSTSASRLLQCCRDLEGDARAGFEVECRYGAATGHRGNSSDLKSYERRSSQLGLSDAGISLNVAPRKQPQLGKSGAKRRS